MTKIQIKQRPLLTRPEQFQGVPPFIAEILQDGAYNPSKN
jgi:single-stranded-DNA-specific exonuclease